MPKVKVYAEVSYELENNQKRILPAGWSGNVPEDFAADLVKKHLGHVIEDEATEEQIVDQSVELSEVKAALDESQKALADLRKEQQKLTSEKAEADRLLLEAKEAVGEFEKEVDSLKSDLEAATQPDATGDGENEETNSGDGKTKPENKAKK
jgi:chromosome segregation ATPase